MRRKIPLATNQTYHIYNKSVGDIKIFNERSDINRMLSLIGYYKPSGPLPSYSYWHSGMNKPALSLRSSKSLVSVIAYCIMPNHFHLVLKQLEEDGITQYMRCIINSFSHYYNTKYERKGLFG